MKTTVLIGAIVLAAGSTGAQVTEFDFQGNAGFGLLPGNEIGGATPVGMMAASDAIGSEVGNSLQFDESTNVLSFIFEFSGLSGGLFDAASGIHFHIGNPGVDPFNETGGITLNLNSGTDAAVTLNTPLIAIGAEGGRVDGSAVLNGAQVDALFSGQIYLNIHSGDFNGGELRGNLVVIPAPASAGLLGLAGVVGLRRRR